VWGSALRGRRYARPFDPKTRSTPVISSRRRDQHLSFRAADEINTCHFEPQARNLEFPFLPVLKDGGVATETASFTVLEAVCRAGWLRSPPIPAFPPIREVLAHGAAAASEIDDHANCTGRKGAVREDAHREVPLSLIGGGEWGWGPMPQLSFRAEGEKS